MSTTRVLLVSSSTLILLLFIYNSFNSEVPTSEQQISEDKPELSQPRVSHNSGPDDAIHTLRSEFRLLKAEMNILKSQLKSSNNNLAKLIDEKQYSSEQQLEEASEGQILDLDLILQDQEEQAEKRMLSMEASLIGEDIDSTWSNSTTDQVQDAFDSIELDGAEVVDVDCRSTLCRIEIDFDDPLRATEYQLWLSVKIGDILPQASMNVSEDGEGNASAVLYLAREGYDLP